MQPECTAWYGYTEDIMDIWRIMPKEWDMDTREHIQSQYGRMGHK
jgi:hypothetical protein